MSLPAILEIRNLTHILLVSILLALTSVVFTPVAGVIESLSSMDCLLHLCCFFFLSFLALLEGLDSWVEAWDLEALELSLQFTILGIWILCVVV